MDILDRLLGHDAWTTRQLLLRCRELTDEQLDRRFEIGDRSLRGTFDHIIEAMEFWTDKMVGRPVRQGEWHCSIDRLLERLAAAAKELAEFSERIQRDGRLDEMFVDTRDDPPSPRPFGATIVHIATHSMHHRAQAVYIMEQLGLTDLIEGDALGWEAQARGLGYGGSYGRVVSD